MSIEITLAYFHFIAIIGTASMLMTEAVLCQPGIQGALLHRLKFVDIGYFSLATMALLTGAMRLFWGAKGHDYYLTNPVFYAKFSLFMIVGLLSIVPTIRFIKWSKAARKDAHYAPAAAAVARVRGFVLLELIVLTAMPLLATLLAHGGSGFR